MNANNIYQKSLNLLDEFLAETSAEEVKALLAKHSKSGIGGPTYAQYLDGFQDHYAKINWHAESEKLQVIDIADCGVVYEVVGNNNYYVPPPILKTKKSKIKKRSANSAERFFLL